MQSDRDMNALVRVLQYAVEEAKRLGVNEIAWAKGLSEGCILLEIGNNGLSSYMEVKLDSEEYTVHRVKPFLSLVTT